MSAERIMVSDLALRVAAKFRAEMSEMHGLSEAEWCTLLAEAHAEIVSAIVLACGGRKTAAYCRQVAAQIEAIPTTAEVIQEAINAVRSA